MKAYFADTAYYLALLSPADEAHERAMEIAGALDRPIVTTEWVLAELGNFLAAPPNREMFIALFRDIQKNADVMVVPSDTEVFAAGMDLYSRRPDKSWSVVDCISFHIMSEHELHDALTTDHHFTQAGFRVLL